MRRCGALLEQLVWTMDVPKVLEAVKAKIIVQAAVFLVLSGGRS